MQAMALRRCLHRCLWLWGSLCCFVDWKVLHVSKAPRVVVISRATSNQPSWLEMVESIKENDTRIAILQEFLTTELKLKDNELKLKDHELKEKDKDNKLNELKYYELELKFYELKLKYDELKLKDMDSDLKLKDKEIQMLTKEILQQRGLFDARGVFVRVVIEVFAEQKMKGAFNFAAFLDKLNKNPSAGKWSKIMFDAMRNCADKSVPKKNLRDVWEEVHLPIHTAGWNGDAVRIPKSLFATSLCVVSELCEQFDFKIDIQ